MKSPTDHYGPPIKGHKSQIAIVNDSFVCFCGNIPEHEGFYDCDSDGNPRNPTPKDDLYYCCDRCGLIVDGNGLVIDSAAPPAPPKGPNVIRENVTLRLCGSEYTGNIERHAYASEPRQIALQFVAAHDDPESDMSKGEPITTLSTCMVGAPITGDNTVFIKDYSENEGVLAQLIALRIVEDTGARIRSGFVGVPVCRLCDDDKGTMSDTPEDEREAHIQEVTQGRTIWNSDGTNGPCLICPPPEGRAE